VRLDSVGRRYGLHGPWVLRDVDLDLPERALLRVEGPNGSGKSTLLRLLAGIDAPSTGRITDRPRAAYVPERFPAALPFTAHGYLTHLGRIHGLRGRVASRRAGEWLERFGAASHARTSLGELSKGTSQKVAVAQALLAEPALLVLDEAWTGLDRAARGTLDRAVAERVADGGTVVFVDHDPRRLAGAADAHLRVEGGYLTPVSAAPPGALDDAQASSGPSAPDGPRVVIEAEGPPGAEPPRGLPGAPLAAAGPDRATLLTVPAVHSDALLRAHGPPALAHSRCHRSGAAHRRVGPVRPPTAPSWCPTGRPLPELRDGARGFSARGVGHHRGGHSLSVRRIGER
jgi:ABC-type Mn2+/Zn2+ transport system ATPase subunit